MDEGGDDITPEELEAFRLNIAINEPSQVVLEEKALRLIDRQATRIKELDDAISGPLENIAKMLETVNADTIFAGVIQTWKNENQTLKSQISDLEKRNADLEARLGRSQVATMQDREAQLQGYIRELEKKVEFWSGVAMKYAPDEEVMGG